MRKLLLVLLLGVFLGGCGARIVPMVEQTGTIQSSQSLPETQNDIVQAAYSQGWYVKDESANPLRVFKMWGKADKTSSTSDKHRIELNISYSQSTYQIQYVSSQGLNYQVQDGEKIIHPSYNKFVARLQQDIETNLSVEGQPVVGRPLDGSMYLDKKGHYKLYSGPRQPEQEVAIYGRITKVDDKSVPGDSVVTYVLPGARAITSGSGPFMTTLAKGQDYETKTVPVSGTLIAYMVLPKTTCYPQLQQVFDANSSIPEYTKANAMGLDCKQKFEQRGFSLRRSQYKKAANSLADCKVPTSKYSGHLKYRNCVASALKLPVEEAQVKELTDFEKLILQMAEERAKRDTQ